MAKISEHYFLACFGKTHSCSAGRLDPAHHFQKHTNDPPIEREEAIQRISNDIRDNFKNEGHDQLRDG